MKGEPLIKLVKRRNSRLVEFFATNGFQVRIVGDEQKPAVILNEDIVLSCFVKNFDLFFTAEPFSDEIVKAFKLNKTITASTQEIQEAIDVCQHRKIHKIRLQGTDLYLVGYNYLNQEQGIGRYPVFARHKPKVYFHKEKAEEIVYLLKQDHYDVVIE